MARDKSQAAGARDRTRVLRVPREPRLLPAAVRDASLRWSVRTSSAIKSHIPHPQLFILTLMEHFPSCIGGVGRRGLS